MDDTRKRDLEPAGGVELLLREPEIVAWLDDYRREPMTAADDDKNDNDDDGPPRAA